MRALKDRQRGLRNPSQPWVEVQLWGLNFRGSQKSLLDTLSLYSIKSHSAQNSDTGEKSVSCLFATIDWVGKIRPLLVKNVIPFKIAETGESILRPSTLAKKKVYLAEDNLDSLFCLNVMLENAGYDVTLSHRATPLMEDTLPPTDLFILDKCLPDGDGLEVVRKLRSRVETMNTPVIMISAKANFDAHIRDAGIDGFLEKPFAMQDFLQLVSKYANQF